MKRNSAVEGGRSHNLKWRQTRIGSKPAALVSRRIVRRRHSRDSNLKRQPLIEYINRPVASESNCCSALSKKARGFSNARPVGTQIRQERLTNVDSRVFPLKRKDRVDTKLRIPRVILRTHNFVVRHRDTDVHSCQSFAHRLGCIEPFANRAVPVCVHMRIYSGPAQSSKQSAQNIGWKVDVRTSTRALHPLRHGCCSSVNEVRLQQRTCERWSSIDSVEEHLRIAYRQGGCWPDWSLIVL